MRVITNIPHNAGHHQYFALIGNAGHRQYSLLGNSGRVCLRQGDFDHAPPKREKDRLRALAHRIVHDPSRAEDVIHDAFVQILRDAKNFDPARGSARGWIYAIVRNTALKMQVNGRRELALGDETLNGICEREQAVSNPASCIPDSMALRTMLDQLEPKHRASLLLAIIDGRTHQEIAEYLRVPVGTVKAWIRLVAMRRQLE